MRGLVTLFLGCLLSTVIGDPVSCGGFVRPQQGQQPNLSQVIVSLIPASSSASSHTYSTECSPVSLFSLFLV